MRAITPMIFIINGRFTCGWSQPLTATSHMQCTPTKNMNMEQFNGAHFAMGCKACGLMSITVKMQK